MFSSYKGLLLFILIAQVLTLPVKRVGTDGKGKAVVFEKIRTVLNCVCYYEEGETLDSSKIDEYCDCTPEKTESDKSLIDGNEAKMIKAMKINDDEGLSDVEKYGSADAAFFADLEKNEAKQDEEVAEEEIIVSGDDGKYITTIDNEDEDDIVEEIPEYKSVDEEVVTKGNKKYIVSEGAKEDDGKDENGYLEVTREIYKKLGKLDSDSLVDGGDIIDENGDVVHVQVEMLGEAYEEEDDGNDDDDDDADDNTPSRPTINRGGSDKFIINNLRQQDDDEAVFDDDLIEIDLEEEDEEEEVPSRPTVNRKGSNKFIINPLRQKDDDEAFLDFTDDEEEVVEEEGEEVVKYRKANNVKMVKAMDEDEDDEDLKALYKSLVIKKLKSDIKKMDSEKLIVNIIKEALQNKN